jgi:AraC-like DNA-binding protein
MGDEVFEEAGSSVAVTHYGQSHDILTDGRGMEIYNVYLDLSRHPLPMLPPSLGPTLSAILPLHPRLRHHLNRRIRIPIGEPARLVSSLVRISEETQSKEPGSAEIVQHGFLIFLMDVCREALRHGFEALGADRNIPSWVEPLRLRLDRDFAQPCSLEQLAEEARVSVTYLCRHFKNYTGKTIVEYLIERRIHAAIWKLREGNDKVLSIALQCGFNDLAYFNRTFKAIVGATPSAYRARFRASGE